MKLLYATLFAFTITTSLFAQDYPREEIDVDAFIDDIFAVQDQGEDINYEDLYEALYQLYLEPLDLNNAGREDLESLFILSELQINSFLDYRAKAGKFLSIYELQSIPHFDLRSIEQLLPFVKIADTGLNADARPLLKRILTEKNNYLFIRTEQVLEERRGYTPPEEEGQSRYAGAPQRLYARFRTSHVRDFSLGFTVEKDAGEQLTWDPSTRRYGMDFYSVHAHFENKGRFKDISIGDYQIQVGQSILLAAGFNVGKGGETVNTVRRSNLGIRPFTSALESGFFRGAAATYTALERKWGEIDVTGFYSRLRRDANVITNPADSLDQVETFISSLQITGFHRTPTEIAAKDAIVEQTFGGNVGFTSAAKNLQVGLTFLYTDFGVTLQRTPRVYNQFEFNGSNNHNIGANYSYNWQNFNFFGEAARSKSGGIGFNQGFIASLTPQVSMAVQYRSFDRDFHSFYGSALGEASRNINERGIYWGIKVAPSKRWTLAGYYDQFWFPWLRFQADAPSQGYEYLGRVSFAPTRKISMFIQYREEMKEENLPQNETNIDFLAERLRRNYIFNLNYAAEKIISFKSRIQYSNFNHGDIPQTEGFVILQDVNFKFSKWELSTRLALFDTDDFQNRQYVYEKDVLYAFSIPAYQDRGTRSYILLVYKPIKKLTFWLRYARTQLTNQDTIGSGLEQIDGNTRSEIKAQVRIKF